MSIPPSRIYRDSVGGYREAPADPIDVDALNAQIDGKADRSELPMPATAAPKSEATGAATGAVQTRYALEDHQHPRLTSTTYAALNGSGQATIAFTRTFVNKPGLNLTETDATAASQPLVLRAIAWVRDGNGLYTGVTIQGMRAQMLPTINPLSGTLTLLSGVITGVNTLVGQLTGYNIFGGSASGANVSVIAIARSDVPSN